MNKDKTIKLEDWLKGFEKKTKAIFKSRRARKWLGYSFIILVFIASGVIFSMFRNSEEAEAGWFDDLWKYRKAVLLSNTSGADLSDFQVSVVIDTASLITAGKMQSDCSDLRFTGISGIIMPFWIEENNPGCNSATTTVWIKVPAVYNGTDATTIYSYYGNSNAENIENGEDVFEFFDDFSGSSLNSGWSMDSGSWELETFDNKSTVSIEPLEASNHFRQADYNSPSSYIIKTRIYSTQAGDTSAHPGLIFNASEGYNDQIYLRAHTPSEFQYAYYNGSLSMQEMIYGGAYGWDIWVNNSLKVNGDTVEIFQEGVSMGTRTGLQYDGVYDNIGFVSHTNGKSYYDFIFVYKYASSEPSFSISSIEEKGPGSVGSWNLNEGYGTTAYDGSGDGNDGTITGAIWQNEDQCVSGKCLYFDGEADYVSLNNFTIERAGGSICFWYKSIGDYTDNYGGRGAVISQGNAFQRLISLRNSGDNYRWEAESNTNGDYIISTGYDYEKNKWQQLCMVASSNTVYSYVDGQLVDTEVAEDDVTFNMFGAGDYDATDSSYRQFFHGYLDEVKVYSYARSGAQIKKDYNAGIAGIGGGSEGVSASFGSKSKSWMSDSLVGYWKMDEVTWDGTAGEVIDYSGGNYNGTSYGTASTTSGKFGKGGGFDGNSDYVDIGDLDVYEFGEESFTLSAWINRRGDSPGDTYGGAIISKGSWGSDNTGYVLYVGDENDDIGFQIRQVDDTYSVKSTAIQDNTWYHAVAIRDKEEEKIKLYINGDLVDSLNEDNLFDLTNDHTLSIGRLDEDVVAREFFGKIDEVRIYNRALSSKEVSDLYNYAPGPIVYLDFDEKTGTTVYDKSGNGNGSVLNNMDASTDWVAGKYGSALDFDGDNDYLRSEENLDFDINAGDWTASVWEYIDKDGPYDGWATILGVGSSYMQGFYVYENRICAFSSEAVCVNFEDSLESYKWHFISVTHEENLKKITAYVDGIKIDSAIYTGTLIDATNEPISIGWRGSSDQFFKGKIDEARIYNYARTQKQILEDMNGGKANKSPLLHLSFDEGYGTIVNDEGMNSDNGSLVDGASWSNSGKIGKAILFDGLNDRIEAFESDPYEYTGEDMTFSAWVYQNSSETTSAYMISKPWNGSGDYNYIMVLEASNVIRFHLEGATSSDISTTETIPNEEWTHILATVTGDNKNVKIYINGKLSKEDTHTISDWTPENPDTNTSLTIGSIYPYSSGWAGDASFTLDGKMDEVKILNYAFSEDEVKEEFNLGSSVVMGAIGTESDGATPSSSASREYCVPGDTATCSPPVVEWDFDEKEGTSAYDKSGNGKTGTLTNGLSWTGGKFGSALEFDGENDLVEAADIDLIDMTISLWLNTQYSTNNQGILSKYDNHGEWNYEIFSNSGGLITYKIGSDNVWENSLVSTISINDNEWHYITATYDRNQMRLYIDGKLDVSVDESQTPGFGIAPLYIGTCTYDDGTTLTYGETDTTFHGKIDEVKIYDYARTPAQVAWDYNKGKPVAEYRFNECQGGIAHDESGNGNHGTISIGSSGTQTTLGTCASFSPSGAWYNGVDGNNNSSLNYDGTDDIINFSGFTGLSSKYVSVSAWVNVNAMKSWNNFVNNSWGNEDPASWLLYADATKPSFGLWNSTNQYRAEDTMDLSDGWHHLVGVYDGTVIRLYVDGSEFATNMDLPNETLDDDGITSIGSKMDGQMDDVKIWNYPLTAEQVKLEYNGGAVRFR